MPAQDRLLLEGMEFYGYHGDLDAERNLGARIRVSVAIEADLATAGRTDAVADTLDYLRCFQLVRDVVENRQYRLLEALAEAIAAELLGVPRALGVTVTVSKQPPVRGGFERFGVTLHRRGTEG